MHKTNHSFIQEKKHILIITTGGTIAGTTIKNLEYKAGNTKGEELIASIPTLKQIATLKIDPISQIGSQDMNDAVLLKIAKRIQMAEKDPTLSGIVITHGTDTMEETAFFLDKVITSTKPIILTGAIRPPNFISADGASNLISAITLATKSKAYHYPVMIVMNDTIFDARNVQKNNTTNLQTFQAPNTGPIGIINNNHVYFYHAPNHTNTHSYKLPKKAPFPRVDIIYAHIQMDGKLIRDAIHRGAKGIVLAGVGNGNSSTEALKTLKEATQQGIIVVRSSRTGSGFVNRNIEINDDENQFIVAADLNPQKARILLQILLANQIYDLHQIQQAFYKLN